MLSPILSSKCSLQYQEKGLIMNRTPISQEIFRLISYWKVLCYFFGALKLQFGLHCYKITNNYFLLHKIVNFDYFSTSLVSQKSEFFEWIWVYVISITLNIHVILIRKFQAQVTMSVNFFGELKLFKGSLTSPTNILNLVSKKFPTSLFKCYPNIPTDFNVVSNIQFSKMRFTSR